jgi:hypothetical protein
MYVSTLITTKDFLALVLVPCLLWDYAFSSMMLVLKLRLRSCNLTNGIYNKQGIMGLEYNFCDALDSSP